jgi:hypothetical protein
VYCQVAGPDNKALFDSCNSEAMLIEDDSDEDGPHYRDAVGAANLRFCVVARNAFGILMRRGWGLKRLRLWGDEARKNLEGWVVCENAEDGDEHTIIGPKGKCLLWAKDPFSVVLMVEDWYKKNVENSHAGK